MLNCKRHQTAPTPAGGLGTAMTPCESTAFPAVIHRSALTIDDLCASQITLTGAPHRLTGIPNRLGRRRARPSRSSNAKAEGGNGRNSNEFGHEMKSGWDGGSRTPAPSLRSFGASGAHRPAAKGVLVKSWWTVCAHPKQTVQAAAALQPSTRQHSKQQPTQRISQRTEVVETCLRSPLRAGSPKSQQSFSRCSRDDRLRLC